MGQVRVGRVGWFLLLTFGLSWGFDLILSRASGYEAYQALGMTPWGMLVPAFVALALNLFAFKDSPIHFRTCPRKPLWILLGFLVLTVAYGVATLVAATFPGAARMLAGLGAVLISLWTLLILFTLRPGDGEAYRRAGLPLGDVKWGQRFVLGIILFFLVQAALNLAFGLGDLQGRAEQIYGVPIPAGLYPFALLVLFIAVAVIGVPLSGLAAVFGEEYGWRGFLQGELVRLGKVRGVFLVGLVWGVWHFPVILSGVHTYPPTALGLLLGLAFFVLWGFVQSYAVLKTGSLWVAALMHGVVNSVYRFMLTYGVRPEDKVASFGLGVYGLLCLAAVVGLILRDPLWRRST